MGEKGAGRAGGAKEAEREEIINQLNDMGKNILNLNEYIAFSLGLKDNLLKLWQLSNLAHKRIIQNLIFPDGLRYNKENEDIEPLSKNEFLFTFNLDSSNYEEKEKGQTLKKEDLSFDAPLGHEILNLWIDFKKVVKFIDDNASWLKPSLAALMKNK